MSRPSAAPKRHPGAADLARRDAFAERVHTLQPGQGVTYHVGLLAADRLGNPALDLIADVALGLAREGLVHLTQRLRPDGRTAYLLTRRAAASEAEETPVDRRFSAAGAVRRRR